MKKISMIIISGIICSALLCGCGAASSDSAQTSAQEAASAGADTDALIEEINELKEPIGKQDQYACACGGLNFIEFYKDGVVDVEKLYLKTGVYHDLEKNLLMFYTGQTRSAGSILKEQKQNTTDDRSKIENLHKMVKLARELREELLNGNTDATGDILHTGWIYKKELAKGITNLQIDEAYEAARKAGASGGKLLGAGGGGFLLFYVKEEHQTKVREALKNLKELNFKFDNKGTNIIYYNKSNLYKEKENA